MNNFSVILGRSQRSWVVNQYCGELKVTCSRTLYCARGDRTQDLALRSPTLYHLSYHAPPYKIWLWLSKQTYWPRIRWAGDKMLCRSLCKMLNEIYELNFLILTLYFVHICNVFQCLENSEKGDNPIVYQTIFIKSWSGRLNASFDMTIGITFYTI